MLEITRILTDYHIISGRSGYFVLTHDSNCKEQVLQSSQDCHNDKLHQFTKETKMNHDYVHQVYVVYLQVFTSREQNIQKLD